MSWRRSPLPRDWNQRRRRVLVRDGYRCRIKGPRCIGRANEVDHIGRDDDHDEANLRAACSPCHRSRSARQARAAQASQYRPRERHPGLLGFVTWGMTPLRKRAMGPAQSFATPYGSGISG